MILSVTLNPCVDKTLFVEGLRPHDTNRVVRVETDAGGKGVNLSRIVTELGGATLATGFLGGGNGATVRYVLETEGVPHEFVESAGETRANFSVESGDGPPTVFGAKGETVSGLEWEQFLALAARRFAEASWVAMGGSLPPGLPSETYAVLGAMARESAARWVADADGDALRHGLAAAPDLIKPNRSEAGRLVGREIESVGDALSVARQLRGQLTDAGSPDPVVVVSLGAEGAVMACADGAFIGDPVEVRAVSTIGSGDSLVAAVLWANEGGLSWPEALRWGLAAGAATAMTDGTQIGQRPDIERNYERAKVRSA